VSLGQVLLIIWRRAWIVLLTLLSAMAMAGAVLFFVPGRYDAVATASIDPGAINPVTEMGSSNPTAIGLTQGNMLQLVQSERVAVDVVKRLNLTANPLTQLEFRNSGSFGRESIDEWMAASLLKNVEPKFILGTNVLTIKYKTGDPNQASLIANAFLAATIDATVAMKAASADRTARWFAPQIDDLHKELDAARDALEAFQSQTNVVAPSAAADSESSTLMNLTQQLSASKGALTALESRLASDSTDLSADPSDPDLQLLASLKEKLSTSEAAVEGAKSSLGANNPKMLGEHANIAALRKQIADATEKMRDHLGERIVSIKHQIASLEASQGEAQKALIATQAQRNRLGELQRNVEFRLQQLNEREKMEAQSKLESKLTFADIAVLDKATPPIEPSFPKPLIVVPVGIGAGLVLGLLLALIAEMTDRRIRSSRDLELATSGQFLGFVEASKRLPRQIFRPRLRPGY
jgi:uncharacterized protein involved in exopolysaccharide biosynthesis